MTMDFMGCRRWFVESRFGESWLLHGDVLNRIHLGHTFEEGVLPVRDIDAEGIFDLGLVEYAVGRALDGAGEFVGVAGVHFAIEVSRVVGDGISKVEPGGHALVGVVINAVVALDHSLGYDIKYDAGEVGSVGRSSDLVEHYFYLLLRLREMQHRLEEILAVRAVKPRGTEDEIVTTFFENGLFAAELGRTINARGRTFLVLAAGRVVGIATENVVRGDVDEITSHFLHRDGQVSHGVVVNQFAPLGVRLCTIYVGVGRAVDDDINLVRFYLFANVIEIRDVEDLGVEICGRDVGEYAVVFDERGVLVELVAELSARTRDEDIHIEGLIERVVNVEIGVGVGKARMVLVLFREDGFVERDLPINRERGVERINASVRLRRVEVIAFVLEGRNVAQHRKAVGKTSGDEKLTLVFGRKFYGHVLPEGGAAVTNIDRHVKDSAFGATHQFALAIRSALIVKTTDDAARGVRLVILHKADRAYVFLKLALRERLKEISALILENTRFEDENAGEGCCDKFHVDVM